MRTAAPVLLGTLVMSVVPTTACSGCARKPEQTASIPRVGNGDPADEEPAATDEEGHEGDEAVLPVPRARPASTGLGGAPVVAAEASRQLSIMRRSVYSHKTRIDEPGGLFEYDCSGFLDYCLENVAPDGFAELQRATVKRPLAKHFVAFFGSIPPNAKVGRWHRVERVVDAVPGDILAWLEPADVVSRNTGHVMMVRGAPVTSASRADEVTLPIYDSTSVRHGTTDSRYASHATGLGTGEILLIVGEAGQPLRYRWSHGKKAREHSTTIAIGHID